MNATTSRPVDSQEQALVKKLRRIVKSVESDDELDGVFTLLRHLEPGQAGTIGVFCHLALVRHAGKVLRSSGFVWDFFALISPLHSLIGNSAELDFTNGQWVPVRPFGTKRG